MTDMSDTLAELVHHFETIYREHMQDLPIVNRNVQVEAVGFQDYEGHELGVLITPWFMNLVLLPGSDEWAGATQGDTSNIDFPSGPIEFTISHDDRLGTYLTAVLFRSVSAISDQPMARELAGQVMQKLFVEANSDRSVSRRELLTGLRSS